MTAGAPVDVVELIGNPRPTSRTRTLADLTAQALAKRLTTPLGPPRVLELAEIVGVTFGPEPASGNDIGDDPFAVVRSAQLLVVATPTYKGTYTGLLKLFLDQFAARALEATVAVPVAVAASPAHLCSVSAALRALLLELGATLPDEALAIQESQLPSAEQYVHDWAERHTATIDTDLQRPLTAGRS
jgi:FMN reductase